MSKQVYFVVAVDLDSKEIFIDDDRFVATFDKSEGTWDSEAEEWSETDWDDEFIPAQNILTTALFGAKA